MDSGISDMLNSVLSNPDSLNKIMTLMPAVAQMMNNGGAGNQQETQNNQNNQNIQEKTVKPADFSADDLMSNAEVADALKHLITALNAASGNNNTPAVEVKEKSAVNADALASLTSFASQFKNNAGADANKTDNADGASNNNSAIEKTLDTLKNFSSATSPESDHRLKLLLALKPFMKDGRKSKIDSAIKYMNAAKIIKMFGKNGFV